MFYFWNVRVHFNVPYFGIFGVCFVHETYLFIVHCHFISRSYSYTVWSAIVIIMSSVCLSVMLCIVALRVGLQGQKLYWCVPIRQVSICPFRHFFCNMYCLDTKRIKNELKKTRMWVSWDGQSGVCRSCYILLFTVFVNNWTSVTLSHHTWVDKTSLGVFINSNKKLSYRRERARQLPTWRGLSPPVHSPSPLATPMRTVESETRNKRICTSSVPSAKRTLSWTGHSRSFKVILICADRNPERCIVVMSN